MSIETEITRISTNVSDTLSAVSEMGGEVPEGATSNDMAAGVRSIPVGAKIDDTTPSSTTVYSSQKIESVVSALNEALGEISTQNVTTITRTTTPSEPTATSGSAWAVAVATRIKNLGKKITKAKLRYISSGDATVSCKILADDFSTILAIADNTKTISSGYGYIEFEFSNANISNENVYICFESSDKVFASYIATSNYDANFVANDEQYKFRVKYALAGTWYTLDNKALSIAVTFENTTIYVKSSEEVISARGGFSDLGERLNVSDVALNELVKQKYIQFMRSNINKFCTSCVANGKYLYIAYNYTAGCFVDKYDVSFESYPINVTTLKLSNENLACSDMKIENGYIYVVIRDGDGGTNTTEGKTLGELHIIDEETFTEATEKLTMDWKCTALTVYKDYMLVSMQLAGYDLYDLTNPTAPTLSYSFRPSLGSVEYQETAFFERNDHTYFIGAGFGFGFYIWDVTDKTSPTRVGTFMFGTAWNDGDNYNLHTSGIVIDGNYVYATIAVAESKIGTQYDKRGIIVFDISDLSVYNYESMGDIPYKHILIDEADYSTFYSDYDLKPTRLVKVGDTIVTNSGANGLSSFYADGLNSKYTGLIKVSDTSIIDRICSTEDGRIFGVNCYNTGLTGKDAVMIRLVN